MRVPVWERGMRIKIVSFDWSNEGYGLSFCESGLISMLLDQKAFCFINLLPWLVLYMVCHVGQPWHACCSIAYLHESMRLGRLLHNMTHIWRRTRTFLIGKIFKTVLVSSAHLSPKHQHRMKYTFEEWSTSKNIQKNAFNLRSRKFILLDPYHVLLFWRWQSSWELYHQNTATNQKMYKCCLSSSKI